MKIGNTIKRLRNQKRITLKKMSKLTGIQVATLSRIENDQVNGTINNFILISGGLDMLPSELFTAIEEDGELE